MVMKQQQRRRLFSVHNSFVIYMSLWISSIRAFRSRVVRSTIPFKIMSLTTTTSIISNNEQQQQQRPQILIIAGPTGVGKSDVAAILCQEKHGMIVSADSVQTYRGVQIGANKPSLEERQETPHFLIDVVNANETYNAAEWRTDALYTMELMRTIEYHHDDTPSERHQQLQEQITTARQQKGYSQHEPIQPIVVGGTMMYLQWLVEGIPDAAKPNASSVARALETIQSYGDDFEKAAAYVSSLDPTIATRVHTLCGKDWYRLRRILEIAYTAIDDDPKMDMNALFTGARQGPLDSCGYDVRCFFLCPTDRMQHTAIVDERCEKMLIQGLLQETTDLTCHNQLPEMATRAIGYRQALEYLQRSEPNYNDEPALEQFIDDFTTATRRYAKKQMQWFRKSQEFVFVPIDLMLTKEERVQEAAQWITELSYLSRLEFEAQLLPLTDNGNPTISAKTKADNEAQGKKMKFYAPKRYILKRESTEYQEVMKQADKCTARIQQLVRMSEQANEITQKEHEVV